MWEFLYKLFFTEVWLTLVSMLFILILVKLFFAGITDIILACRAEPYQGDLKKDEK